ncbi:MAG: carbamoyl phosphate synthase small subunit [Caulobacter sp.]|nr:carbamoyl phosphate synthase small subunit [Caulobacter sp.]
MTDLLPGVTGVLVLADGTVLQGIGVGAAGEAVGEVCFNTAMTGYQEILTDPSYMAQIVAFTFPHMGNTGTNSEDLEQIGGAAETAARGAIFRDVPTEPANWRANATLNDWMTRRGVIGLAGVDTRSLTRLIREQGTPHAVIAHSPTGDFDIPALVKKAAEWSGLVGLDLAKDATTRQTFTPVVPADTSAEDSLARKPDGVLRATGPGDPAATGAYAVPEIRKLVDSGTPVFGICLGHQMMALALGAKTVKMDQGHHGANHPVKDLTTGKVEIVSMNHGFTVDRDSLPAAVTETHVSLFDGTNAGLALADRPVFSVQHHPEASPGPTDSLYLFERFAGLMDKAR